MMDAKIILKDPRPGAEIGELHLCMYVCEYECIWVDMFNIPPYKLKPCTTKEAKKPNWSKWHTKIKHEPMSVCTMSPTSPRHQPIHIYLPTDLIGEFPVAPISVSRRWQARPWVWSDWENTTGACLKRDFYTLNTKKSGNDRWRVDDADVTAISSYLASITIARNEGCFRFLLFMHPQTVNARDGKGVGREEAQPEARTHHRWQQNQLLSHPLTCFSSLIYVLC